MSTLLRSSISFVLFVALSVPSLLFAGPVIGTDGSTGPSGNQTYRVINETPQGVINGWNTDFTLSHVPQTGSTVHLYRNGVPLVDPTDYQIKACVITVSPNQVPQVGDTLDVSYVGTDSVTRSIASPLPTPPSVRYLDEISIAATREALRDEEGSLSMILDGSPTDRRLHLHHNLKQPTQSDLEALQMLSARLADGSQEVADGVEGLGDAAVPSVYSFHRADTANDRSLPTSSGRYRQPSTSLPEPRSSRAIGMLEGRLGTNDPQQLGNIANGLDSEKTHSISLRDIYHPHLFRSGSLRAPRTSSSEAIDMLDRKRSIDGQLDIPREHDSEQ